MTRTPLAPRIRSGSCWCMAAGQVLPGEFFLQDGTPAMIWPLLPTDAEMLREGFAGCRRIRASAGSWRRSVSSMTR